MIDSVGMKVNIFFRLLGGFSFAGLTALALPAAADGQTKAQATSPAPDTSYVRYATGIDIYGSPKDWYRLAARYGYHVSEQPVVGGVVCFDNGAYGTNPVYGSVAVVVYYQDEGNYWNIGTRYAYPATDGANYDYYSYVKEQSYRVLKNDPNVHYIYRRGMNVRPIGYYSRPEYAGYDAVGKQYTLSNETKELTIYPKKDYVKAYVGAGQVVRVLAKAEVGETLWVLVKTPYRAGKIYAQTSNYGKEQLRRFAADSTNASELYYAQNYGDTVLDLGYADYSKIAGDSGEVTITIKKGKDPMRLQPLQTISLQLSDK